MRYHILILVSILAACEGSQIKQGQEETASSKEVVTTANSEVDPQTPSANSSTPLVEVEPAEAASLPISIGGASLTCSVPNPDQALALCSATDKAGSPQMFNAKKAYFIGTKDPTWKPTTFYPGTAFGSWVVVLPYSVKDKSFAVSLIDDESKAVFDWVINPLDLPPSLVKDGSFDQDSSFSFRMRSSVTINGRETIKICEEVKIGKEWKEMNSGCLASKGASSSGSNMVIYQDLNLKTDHYYEISFSYRRRSDGSAPQELQFRFDGATVLQQPLTTSSWTKYQTIQKASKNQIRMEFEQNGDSFDDDGSLIDDVTVYDLGAAPL